MTTKAHSLLTGTDLHESKGVASATVGTVYVADGAGSGTWKLFAAPYLHVREEQAASVDAGDVGTLGSWHARVLNTVVTNTITSASLASNQISLPSGTYRIAGNAPFYGIDNNQLRLQNVTDATTLLVGGSNYAKNSSTAASIYNHAHLHGQFTLAGTKTLEFQYRTSRTSNGGQGLGVSVSWGTNVYAVVEIWKLV